MRLALKVIRSWHDKPPHKCVLECSQHNLSSHGFILCFEEQAEAAVPAWRELDEAVISKGLTAAVTHNEDDSKTGRIQG